MPKVQSWRKSGPLRALFAFRPSMCLLLPFVCLLSLLLFFFFSMLMSSRSFWSSPRQLAFLIIFLLQPQGICNVYLINDMRRKFFVTSFTHMLNCCLPSSFRLLPCSISMPFEGTRLPSHWSILLFMAADLSGAARVWCLLSEFELGGPSFSSPWGSRLIPGLCWEISWRSRILIRTPILAETRFPVFLM